MSLGGLLCLLGIVALCKFRDANVAIAQAPEPAPIADKSEKSGEPPLAEPRPLPPVGVGVLKALNPPAAAPVPAPPADVKPAVAETPAAPETRPILIPASATADAASTPPPPPMTATPLPPPPAPPADVPPPPPSGGAPLPPIKAPEMPVVPPPAPPSPPSTPPAVPMKPAEPVVDASVRPLPALRCKSEAKPKAVLPLTGTYPLKMDAGKGLSLPKAILTQLGKCDMVMLSPGSDKCLWLTNQAHLDRLTAKLDRSPAPESEIQGFKRLYYAQTVKVPMKDGKVVITERLAQFAGLGQDLVLVGIDDHFEVWDSARWQRYTQARKAAEEN
jgi:division/cell wall cluster transcriptional repressor MraZ